MNICNGCSIKLHFAHHTAKVSSGIFFQDNLQFIYIKIVCVKDDNVGREQRDIIKHLRCSCLVKFNFVFCIPCWVFRCSQCLKDGRARGWIKVNHILWFFLGLDSCLTHIKWRTRPRHINYSGKHPEGYKKLVESSCKGWRNLGRCWELSSNSNKVMY